MASPKNKIFSAHVRALGWFFSAFFLLLPTSAWSHLPNVATFNVQQREQLWWLDVHVSTDGLHHILTLRDPKIQALSAQDYKKRAVTLIKEGVRVNVDGGDIELGEGGIRLAAHQTDLRFELVGMPQAPARFQLEIDVFSEQSNQQNIFRVFRPDGSDHVVLSERNRFAASLIRGHDHAGDDHDHAGDDHDHAGDDHNHAENGAQIDPPSVELGSSVTGWVPVWLWILSGVGVSVFLLGGVLALLRRRRD